MLKKIGTDDMRKHMGEILDCVNLRGDEFIIKRKQKPIAALIPITKLEAMTKMAKEHVLEQISGQSKMAERDIEVLMNKAKHLSRKTKTRSNKKKS